MKNEKLFVLFLPHESKPKSIHKKNKTMATIQLTEQEFLNKVYDYKSNPGVWTYAGDRPAVIDFYAPWCGPCRRLAPIMEELAEEYGGRVAVYKVNVDEERGLAGVFGIRSIPTILFVPADGSPTAVQGALPKNDLRDRIDNTLLKKA